MRGGARDGRDPGPRVLSPWPPPLFWMMRAEPASMRTDDARRSARYTGALGTKKPVEASVTATASMATEGAAESPGRRW